jgi:sugar lactone lactonase YvrE
VADSGNRKIRTVAISNGEVSSLTGGANTQGGYGAADGPGATATFLSPAGITTDGTTLYVADTGNNKIRKVSIADATVTSMTGVANARGAEGAQDGLGTAATLFPWANVQNFLVGITTDGTNLYVADKGNQKIRKIVIATGQVSSVTGVTNTPSGYGAADGPGGGATFSNPSGITTDGSSLFVVDTDNNTVRTIR